MSLSRVAPCSSRMMGVVQFYITSVKMDNIVKGRFHPILKIPSPLLPVPIISYIPTLLLYPGSLSLLYPHSSPVPLILCVPVHQRVETPNSTFFSSLFL